MPYFGKLSVNFSGNSCPTISHLRKLAPKYIVSHFGKLCKFLWNYASLTMSHFGKLSVNLSGTFPSPIFVVSHFRKLSVNFSGTMPRLLCLTLGSCLLI